MLAPRRRFPGASGTTGGSIQETNVCGASLFVGVHATLPVRELEVACTSFRQF
ncbi:MAG: hypothetical protein SGJ27_27275 [Candidatus Melainabacteria bacterium]|nr:hypothetical protein [Candidatus Melainabacteria bacterium]